MHLALHAGADDENLHGSLPSRGPRLASHDGRRGSRTSWQPPLVSECAATHKSQMMRFSHTLVDTVRIGAYACARRPRYRELRPSSGRRRAAGGSTPHAGGRVQHTVDDPDEAPPRRQERARARHHPGHHRSRARGGAWRRSATKVTDLFVIITPAADFTQESIEMYFEMLSGDDDLFRGARLHFENEPGRRDLPRLQRGVRHRSAAAGLPHVRIADGATRSRRAS